MVFLTANLRVLGSVRLVGLRDIGHSGILALGQSSRNVHLSHRADQGAILVGSFQYGAPIVGAQMSIETNLVGNCQTDHGHSDRKPGGSIESTGRGRVLALRVDAAGSHGLQRAVESANEVLTVLEAQGYAVKGLEIRGHLLRERGASKGRRDSL